MLYEVITHLMDLFSFMADFHHLDCTGRRMNGAIMPPSPVVSIIMLVDPHQHVEIALLGFEHYAAITLIDTHRMDIATAGIQDFLVVDARAGGIMSKLADELLHLSLLCPGNAGKGT